MALHRILVQSRPSYTNLIDKVYNQIDRIIVTDKDQFDYTFCSMDDRLFKQILAKLNNINTILRSYLTLNQVNYIFDNYNDVNYLEITNFTINQIAHKFTYNSDHIDLDDNIKIIDVLYKYNYFITYDQLKSIYDYEYYNTVFDDVYELIKKIVIE